MRSVVLVMLSLASCASEAPPLLRRVLSDAAVPKNIVEPLLSMIVAGHTRRHQHIVVLLRDMETSGAVVTQVATARLIVGEVQHMSPQRHVLGVTVVRGQADVPELLGKIAWSAGTKFFVVMPWRRNSDEMYLELLRFQDADLEHIVTRAEIERDWSCCRPGPQERPSTRVLRHETRTIFNEFWEQGVVNLIVAVPQRTNVYLYGFFPFTSQNCADIVVPVLVNVWMSPSQRFYKGVRLYPDKMKRLHGCPLTVSLVKVPPGVVQYGGRLEGIEAEMLQSVFQAMNATMTVRFIPESDGNSSTTAMSYVLDDLSQGESDFGAGLLIPTFPHSHVTEDINFSLTVCLAWVVPRRNKTSGFLGYIPRVFKSSLWALTAASIAVSGLLLWSFLRHRASRQDTLDLALYKILTVFLGKNTRFPRSEAARIFLMSYIWFSIILGTAFQAGLGSHNLAPDTVGQLETSDQVLNSGLRIASLRSITHLFDHEFDLKDRRGRPAAVKPSDVREALVAVAEGSTAYIGLRLSAKYYTKLRLRDLEHRIHISDNCIVQYHTFLALRRNSPFTETTNKLMSSLIEAGFKERLSKKFLLRMSKPSKLSLQADIDQDVAYGAVKLWCVGILASLVVFLCELLAHRLETHSLKHIPRAD